MTQKHETLETEILKAESVLSEIELELMKESPSYAKLKALATEVVNCGTRILKGVERDKAFFYVDDSS